MPNYANFYGSSQSVAFDRREWDAFYARMTGADPRSLSSKAAGMGIADEAVKIAAQRGQELIKADTPVLTGTLQGSIETLQNAPADWSIATFLYYAGIVESRPPGGPARGRGAMFAQNTARIQVILDEEVRKLIDRLAG